MPWLKASCGGLKIQFYPTCLYPYAASYLLAVGDDGYGSVCKISKSNEEKFGLLFWVTGGVRLKCHSRRKSCKAN